VRLLIVVLAGLIVGVVDLAFAIVFWAARADVPPTRILQSIARGVLGRDAFTGGAATAALGVALHFVIAVAMAATYAVVAKHVPALVKHAVACGLAYGLALYAVMSFVVLPLSAAGKPSFEDHGWVGASIAMHAVFGVIFAVGARRASGSPLEADAPA
jgi:uncharacterized membrane protein YagU involved in acid resistance